MRVVIEINDGTGCFKVIFYQKDAASVPQAMKEYEFKKFQYVKVFGSIRVYKEEKAIVGTNIRNITNFKEITNHFLQSFVSSQMRQNGVLGAKELSGSGASGI